MARYAIVVPGLCLLLSLAGCASALSVGVAVDTDVPPTTPKLDPDEREWRRKPVPLPPLYMDIKTGGGERWKMVTPLFWDVSSPSVHWRALLPVFGHREEVHSDSRSGIVLNYAWQERPERKIRTLFPVFWQRETPASKATLYGPLFVRRDREGDRRERTLLFPWIYSSERDATGYDYKGILLRLFAIEKQVFEGEQRKRLWLFHVFRIGLDG